MQLIGSVRGANFAKYQTSLIQLMPWIFSLDYFSYARWLSVHVRDMHTLQERLPQVHREFCRGAFVARKTACSCSVMTLDQAHEQVNALVKGDGGAVGLTDNW